MNKIPNDQKFYTSMEEVRLLHHHLSFLHMHLMEWNAEQHENSKWKFSQEVVSRFIPSTFNLAFSFYELLTRGWLYPAEVLVRPVAERLGTMTYFAFAEADAVQKWNKGWKMGQRPSLKTRLELLPTAPTSEKLTAIDWIAVLEAKNILISLSESLNSAIHGDEHSLLYTIRNSDDHGDMYCVGPDHDNSDYASHLALSMASLTMFFPLVLEKIFPDFLQGKPK